MARSAETSIALKLGFMPSGQKIVAPKVGGSTIADGSLLAADGQSKGTPSVRL